MGKRNTRVTPTVATEPSEQDFTERGIPVVLNPEAIGNPDMTPIVQLPPEQATPKPPRPRRVSAEAVKAETRLANIQRASQASIAACLSGWAKKRADFIATLPHDVQGMLLAGGVITDDDLEGLPRRETDDA